MGRVECLAISVLICVCHMDFLIEFIAGGCETHLFPKMPQQYIRYGLPFSLLLLWEFIL